MVIDFRSDLGKNKANSVALTPPSISGSDTHLADLHSVFENMLTTVFA